MTIWMIRRLTSLWFWSLLVICKEDSPNDDFLDQKRPNMAGSSVFLGGPKGPKWPKMVNLTVIHCESQNALCVFRARIQVLSEIVQNVSNWSTRVPDDQIHLGPLFFTIWATLELWYFYHIWPFLVQKQSFMFEPVMKKGLQNKKKVYHHMSDVWSTGKRTKPYHLAYNMTAIYQKCPERLKMYFK